MTETDRRMVASSTPEVAAAKRGSAMVALQRLLALLIVAGVAGQFFLAGTGAFGATGYAPHRALGDVVAIAVFVAFLISLAARRHVRPSALLLVAVVIQVVLGSLGTSSSHWFGAFHGLNALFVGALAGGLLRANMTASVRTP